ncbi:MAG: hypothetical protein IKU29_04465, partial [Parabacteroides sp.]|nr:hypothetical protein [Parabacteroides sp.]
FETDSYFLFVTFSLFFVTPLPTPSAGNGLSLFGLSAKGLICLKSGKVELVENRSKGIDRLIGRKYCRNQRVVFDLLRGCEKLPRTYF